MSGEFGAGPGVASQRPFGVVYSDDSFEVGFERADFVDLR